MSESKPGVEKQAAPVVNQPAAEPQPSHQSFESESDSEPSITSNDEFWGGQVEIRGLEALPEGQSYKGMRPLKEFINILPTDVKKTLKNFQSDYTKKTQELAEIRKELEIEREQIRRNQEFIQMNIEKLGALKQQEFHQDDLYEPEKLSQFLAQEQQKNNLQFYQNMQQEFQKKEAEREFQENKTRALEFVASKEEFKIPEFKQQVAQLIESSNLSLEDAYLLVKQKMPAKNKAAELEEFISKSNLERDRKETLLKLSNKTNTNPKGAPKLNMKGLSASERFRLLQQYEAKYGKLPEK